MQILILGGDGYLGWPTAMHLSSIGHKVAVVDNYLRRDLMLKEDIEPLYSTPNLSERVKIWKEISGHDIELFVGDLNDWNFVSSIFKKTLPEAIVHYAEQPSAPYSMLRRETATLTLKNNIMVTANIIFAVREFCPNAHIVKLGTMGEYGTPNIDIEEGWININHNGRKDQFLFPRQSGSLYHTTKIMDTDLLWFYVRVWGLKVTDLMQGPVYGVFTTETELDTRLATTFTYDEIFGTVLNRFIVQAVAGYPLTVYGKGGQTRGYINIRDTINCIKLSIENPAEKGQLRVFNQFTETFSVNDLAFKIQSVSRKLGFDVSIKKLKNPRKELEEHYYNPKHSGLTELGLTPNFLDEEELKKMFEFVLLYKKNININKIFSGYKWD